MVEKFGLIEIVEFLGFVPHEDSLKFQDSCDALLLTSSNVIGGQDYSIAGKTFEYLSMKKPIVGFVSDGAQKRLLEQVGMALICDPDQPEISADKLAHLIEGRYQMQPNEEFLDSLHRKELTHKFVDILKNDVLS